ncbi:Gfo/Idh/MocA family oxidoreductase [Candidatus Poribacteria bacterium]|jgi:UDP-N-acetylglucosamine 3-dehydrogenase|nr:Gfo/Idh/MocA family oxidoreductase [Candidatus Poribacteria bacterium]MBT5536958.1 Gfo/Idh/MocA family oxidoreductase [Candidatus Poribacteria bacterium]MBT7804099.1 Gfo/Idh/MocA family oxidoreductase [Candidatus Poribacteria bacterium]
MLRTAVIGLGHIGLTHCACYRDSELADFVAVCDMDEDRAAAQSQSFDVPAYATTADLFGSADVDAVSVCTAGFENGSHHHAPVMAALEAGKHVLCEKPLSNDLGQAREMVAEAKTRGLYLGTNLNHRFTPFAWQAKGWMDEGEDGRVGQPLFVNMALRIENPNESSPFFHVRALHPHSLDVMRFFAGEAEAVHAFANRAPGRVNWSNISVNLHYRNGAIGHLSGSYDAGTLLERTEVAGTNGRFVIEGVYEELHYWPRRGSGHEVYTNPPAGAAGHIGGFDDTFTARLDYWLQQLTDNVSPDEIEASGEAGLRVQEIVEAAIESFTTKTVVTL